MQAMDASDKSFPDNIAGILKSWIPWKSEPANVSRDFWMPDQSCRVCYDCDSQFTLFNRRHHCRHCGRVFCAKCTSNWIPVPSTEPRLSREEWDKIRVCNYCFKQWEQGSRTVIDNNGIQVVTLDLSTSPSATSFISSKSSATVNSSSITFASVPHLGGDSPHHSSAMEAALDREHIAESGTCNDPNYVETTHQDISLNQFGFGVDRGNYDDDEFGAYHSKSRHFPPVDGFYEFDDIDDQYGLRKVHPDAETVDTKSLTSLTLYNSFDSQASEEVQQIIKKETELDIGDECEASSSLFSAADVNTEPVDFENNGVLWLPPEPENEEDEHEPLLYDDDDHNDDGDASGEWGYLRSSSSFGSGEQRNRDKSSEEHKRAMKDVVDGHFRALVAQLLQVENIPVGEENEREGWLEIITALSWEAATLLKPDMSKSGGMDSGGYAKVKCIASGLRSESKVVKGVVFKKNVAHRRMTSKIEKPRIMILGGALEYQRVSNLLSSFDTLLQQEMDHLKMAVAKIDSHQPDVLLVEKSVSRYAQDYLLAKNISLVLNIKRPLLERIARCTGGQIAPTIDHLESQNLGHCDLFHVERFQEEHGTAEQSGKKLFKTLMYFEGCPKPLGCTILLRGANDDELKKVKHVVQYGVFAAYHLALETSFLADEGASLPELPLNSPITVALPEQPAARFISSVRGLTDPLGENMLGPLSGVEPKRSTSLPTPEPNKVTSIQKIEMQECPYPIVPPETFLMKQVIQNSLESFSSSSYCEHSPRLASRERTIENAVAEACALSNVPYDTGDSVISNGLMVPSDATGKNAISDDTQNDGCELDAISNTLDQSSFQLDAKQVQEESPEFPPDPSNHQSILVSLSSRCVWKGTVCERSHLFRIKYYGSFDKPLGRFLRDHLFDQSYRCPLCDMPSEAHVQCYTHRQGTLTISVKKLPEFLLPGEKEGKIWMWHRCLRCPRSNGFPPATRRIVMSDAAWGLSFGKFLELSFSNHAAASRVASCGHSLHRDCLRFYGFGKMVACFRYASIDVHSVYLPPAKLDFNYESQEWIQQELNEVVGRADHLFSEVQHALHVLVEKTFGSVTPSCNNKIPDSRRQLEDLEGMLQREKAEFADSLQRILNKELKKGQPLVDILEVNRLRRQLLFQSYMWDHRLIYIASSDKKISQSDVSMSDSPPVQENHVDETIDSNLLVKPEIDGFDSACGDTESNSHNIGACGDQSLDEDTNQVIDRDAHADYFKENLSVPSMETDMRNEYDQVESDATAHRVLSDGQLPIMPSLSDTLDAAWTGKNHPLIGISKDNAVRNSETASVDSSVNAGVADKLEVEIHTEDLTGSKLTPSPLLSSRGSEIMEDSVSWLGLPFISFYRSLNKNFLGNTQKLDNFVEYNPVYISSFRESELQGGARLLLPVGVNDTVIPVYDDEPTSIISYALASPDYLSQISDDLERPKDAADSSFSLQSIDSGNLQSFNSMDEMTLESFKSLGSADESILSLSGSRGSLVLDPLSYTKAMHAQVSLTDDGPQGKVKYTVTCYYAKRFDALRRICCPSEVDFIRSLSRCKKWGAQGGKSNVFFAKTLDDRFIIKQVTKTELESFIKFAPGYFKYLSQSIGSRSPTCLAKILGIFQVTSKHLKGGKESKMDVLVMENLLFGRNVTRLYDLKGSSRSRYNPDSSGSNKVLLDQNLIEAMPTSPIFVGNKAKRLLERAVWNDTAFLASIDVMDYSLLVGVDEEKQELVLGIIDFMRQYTWDKHLETWVKASGILGGPKNASPTVISPKQYKKRFRKAMTTYFLMVPDQWAPPTIVSSKSQTDLSEENSQGGTPAE